MHIHIYTHTCHLAHMSQARMLASDDFPCATGSQSPVLNESLLSLRTARNMDGRGGYLSQKSSRKGCICRCVVVLKKKFAPVESDGLGKWFVICGAPNIV